MRDRIASTILSTRPHYYFPLWERGGRPRQMAYPSPTGAALIVDAAPSGTPEYGLPGPHGETSIGFDADADYLTLDVGNPVGSAFSAGAWAWQVDLTPPVFDTILSNAVPSWTGWAFHMAGGIFTIDTTTGPSGGFGSPVSAPAGTIVAQRWSHVAFSVDAGGTGRLFLNGRQVAQGATTGGNYGDGQGMRIANFTTTHGRTFRGRLAHLAYYATRAVTEDEWLAIARAGLRPARARGLRL